MTRYSGNKFAFAAVAIVLAAVAAHATETTTYTYDTRGRLVKVEHSGMVNDGVATQYGLDKADNRSNVTVTGAPNLIMGTANNDTLTGTSGADLVYGLAGNDIIWVQQGADTVDGGAGNDAFLFLDGFTAADHAIGGGGTADQIGLRGNYTGANALVLGANAMTGISTIAILTGHSTTYGPDAGDLSFNLKSHDANVAAGQQVTITGNTLLAAESLTFDGSSELDGTFRLFGGQGADTLTGGAGADLIYGALGVDTLTGGAGNDTFQYNTASDSVSGSTDHINDFRSGDIISLSTIDSNSGVTGNQAFSFIGASAFSNSAGQLRIQSQGGNDWLVQGDVDGNGTADFALALTSADSHTPVAADFIL